MAFFDQNNPRYQRAVKIMKRWDPRQKAIFSTVLADKHFAGTEMGKRLTFLDMARRNKLTEANIDQRRGTLGIARERQDIVEDSAKRGRTQDYIGALMGVADIGMQGYFGAKNMDQKRRLAQLMGIK